ncbi:MAG TPA: hypothetical protein VFU43_05590 [Streptosporangiaceae bacterium]|nr:hypothetical protein [Streptosporangiaceae bacterium]
MNDTEAVARYLDEVMKTHGYSVQGGKEAWYDPERGYYVQRNNDYSSTGRRMKADEWRRFLERNRD